jgi:hypothetical protein
VLAPTYVASGVGGKPTVEFSAVNLQVVNGAGATNTTNGEGNLIVGYAENANNRARTGSHNLIVGVQHGWTSYGDLISGANDTASGAYAAAFGQANTATGQFSMVAGSSNTTTGTWSTVTGGEFNQAVDPYSAIAGGCGNLTSGGTPRSQDCAGGGVDSVLGGVSNRAHGEGDVVAGGDFNTALGTESSVAGGEDNSVADFFTTVAGGVSNSVTAGEGNAIAGGLSETLDGTGTNPAENTRVGSRPSPPDRRAAGPCA